MYIDSTECRILKVQPNNKYIVTRYYDNYTGRYRGRDRHGRRDQVLALVGEKVFAIGGQHEGTDVCPDTWIALTSVSSYDLATNTW